VIKDGGEVYQPDTEYDVDDEVGRRFVILGWATSPDYTAGGASSDTTANVAPNSVRHTTAGAEV
jgi:hypothetical protein